MYPDDDYTYTTERMYTNSCGGIQFGDRTTTDRYAKGRGHRQRYDTIPFKDLSHGAHKALNELIKLGYVCPRGGHYDILTEFTEKHLTALLKQYCDGPIECAKALMRLRRYAESD